MNIYTTGACKENLRDNGVGLGNGGWSYLTLGQEPGRDMEVLSSGYGFKDGTTNQEMDIFAVAEAFEDLKNKGLVGDVILYSDSAYIINCFKDRWYDKWNSNGWLNSKKKPVENREAWERAISAISEFSVTFYHVNKNSTKYIKIVDVMAKKASRKETIQVQL